jgi:hypothetical protein
MKILVNSLVLLASCATVDHSGRNEPNVAYRWINSRTGETILITDAFVTVSNQEYPARDCSTADKWCLETDGPINMVVNRRCDDESPLAVGDHRAAIWSVMHRTPTIRDRRSDQLLYEYSYERGVTAIFYSPEGLGLTETGAQTPKDLTKAGSTVPGKHHSCPVVSSGARSHGGG